MPAPVLVNDTGGGTWQIGVDNNGWLNTTSVTPSSPPLVIIADPLTGQFWIISADVNGFLLATTTSPGTSQTVLLEAPNTVIWQLGVSGQDLITFPSSTGSGVIPPKIIWPSGGSNVLQMTNWPRYVPSYLTAAGAIADYTVVVPTNVFSGAQSEYVYQRTDQFWEGQMEYVDIHDASGGGAVGAGAPTWFKFMAYALRGGNFDYYPNGLSPQFTTYVLENTDWNMEYMSLGKYKFPLKFRLYLI
jgi:hypothetical protein